MTLRRALDLTFTYVVLAVIVVLVVGPFLFMALSSLKTNLDILESPPNLHIFDWDVIKKNYSGVLYGRNFIEYIRNSTIVVAGTTLLALFIATPAAYGFSRFPFRGREDLAFWILSTRFMPVIAVAVP